MSIQESNKLIAVIEALGYFIRNDGVVFSKQTKKPLKMSIGKTGYYKTIIYNDGKSKTYVAHRLVALKYIPNPSGYPEVNHIDGNKLNNHYKNLEWCTRSQNIKHGIKTGLIPAPWKGKYGENHTRSKAVLQCDLNGKPIKQWGSIRQARRETKIHNIDDALSGRNKSAGGYLWKYAILSNSQPSNTTP